MPQPPVDPQRNDAPPTVAPDDAAPDHVVRNLFDIELRQLAFGRPRDEAERERAAAAARELARREADHARRAGETAPDAPLASPAHALARPPARPPTSVADPREARPWWSRTVVVVAGSILAVIAATTIGPALWPSTGGAGALEVFDREATTTELDLRAQLQREGLRVSVTPRVIAVTEDARVVAYRVIVTTTAERPRSEVCVVLVDDEGIGWPRCTDREDFERGGIQTTLSGPTTRYVMQWGPLGAPTVSVLPDGAERPARPSAAAALPFFADSAAQRDTAYAALLRTMHPDDRLLVRVLDATERWDAVGALVASADTERWSYCVHLFAREAGSGEAGSGEAGSGEARSGEAGAEPLRAQLGASVTCAGVDRFERGGLVAEAGDDESTVRVEWAPDGTVALQERATP